MAVGTPKITVLMSVYNGAAYLADAIESILNQTYRDFEFIIIDDGSTDNSRQIIEGYADSRIKLIVNRSNLNLATSLNLGIDAARGVYIARMDADDVSLSGRLEVQSKFLDSHTDISIVGSWAQTVGAGMQRIIKHPSGPDVLKANLLFYTSLVHPSVMLRKADLDEYRLRYDGNLRTAQDYDLWVRAAKYLKIDNVKKVLLLYRQHDSQLSTSDRPVQKRNASLVTLKLLTELGLNPSEKEVAAHKSLRPDAGTEVMTFLQGEEAWLKMIFTANEQMNIYNESALDVVLYTRWKTLCGMNTADGLTVWEKFIASELFQLGGLGKYLDSVKLFIKSLLRK